MFDYSIPNPLTDAGVKQEIRERVESIKNSRVHMGTLDENITAMLRKAAEWGYANGFRMGWRIHEVRSKRGEV